jgi:hypothetical protein
MGFETFFMHVILRSEATKNPAVPLNSGLRAFAEFTLSEANVLRMTNFFRGC